MELEQRQQYHHEADPNGETLEGGADPLERKNRETLEKSYKRKTAVARRWSQVSTHFDDVMCQIAQVDGQVDEVVGNVR